MPYSVLLQANFNIYVDVTIIEAESRVIGDSLKAPYGQATIYMCARNLQVVSILRDGGEDENGIIGDGLIAKGHTIVEENIRDCVSDFKVINENVKEIKDVRQDHKTIIVLYLNFVEMKVF